MKNQNPNTQPNQHPPSPLPSFLRPPSSFLRRQEPRHTHTQPNPITIIVPATLPSPLLRELSAILALVPHTRRSVDGDPNESRLAAALLLSAFMDRLSLHSRKLADPGFQDLYHAVKALQPPEARRPTKKTAVKKFSNQQSKIMPEPDQQSKTTTCHRPTGRVQGIVRPTRPM